MIDLVTMPPSSLTSKNWSSSWPAAAQPEAVKTGFGKVTEPSRVLMSISGAGGASAVGRRVSSLTCGHLRVR
jgi:hypothetical protein